MDGAKPVTETTKYENIGRKASCRMRSLFLRKGGFSKNEDPASSNSKAR